MAKTDAEVSAIVQEGQQEARAIEESTEAEASKVRSQNLDYTRNSTASGTASAFSI
jgi:vacuolar-type H+-ATPase subunit H